MQYHLNGFVPGDPDIAPAEPARVMASSSGPEVECQPCAPEPSTAAAGSDAMEDRPTVAIVIGMAGSGKTSLMRRVNAYRHAMDKPPYIVNLDPAVTNIPYDANIDIRDTVNYKEVMKEYNLGPNGGILTALNLFATRFDQVIGLIDKRRDEALKYALFDTTFSQITRDWRVAVLDQTDPSAELKQALFWYKADPSGPSFRIGKPVFWRLEREHRRAVTDDAMSIAGA